MAVSTQLKTFVKYNNIERWVSDMVCKLCGYSEIGIGCPRCQRKYEEFCKNLPVGWQQLMGPAYSVFHDTPQFHYWAEEQRIKKERLDGTISAAEADRQAKELAEKIRRHYNPTEEEFMATAERLRAQREASKTFFDAPSLFD